jgi:hypothetical protein
VSKAPHGRSLTRRQHQPKALANRQWLRARILRTRRKISLKTQQTKSKIRLPISSAQPTPVPSIADRFEDLLAPLSARRRRGLIARLSVGYYEGWRPSRAEVAELVAQELRRSPR